MYKLEYEEPRDKDLEQVLFEHDNVADYEHNIWKKYIKTEEDREDDEKNDEMEKEFQKTSTSITNLFIKVYNGVDTYTPPKEAWNLINELNIWGDEHSNSIEERLTEFLKLLKEASDNPPERDKWNRLNEIALNEELLDIIYDEKQKKDDKTRENRNYKGLDKAIDEMPEKDLGKGFYIEISYHLDKDEVYVNKHDSLEQNNRTKYDDPRVVRIGFFSQRVSKENIIKDINEQIKLDKANITKKEVLNAAKLQEKQGFTR